ncbi:hypothetical protein APSETT444_005441 [Aspergillus pseudonomiae]
MVVHAFELGLGPLHPLAHAGAGAHVARAVRAVHAELGDAGADAHVKGDAVDAAVDADGAAGDADGPSGAGGGGRAIGAEPALLIGLGSEAELASDFGLVSVVAPAFVVERANEVEPLPEFAVVVVVAVAAVTVADVGVDDVERGPGPVVAVLEVGVDPGLVLEVAGLALSLALRLQLPPVEQRHRPYEDAHEDAPYRTVSMKLSLPPLALGLRVLHFPLWLTALSTAVAVAGVVALVAHTVLVAAADIGAADKLVGTGAAGPVIDMASAGPAAIGTEHAADRTAVLAVALVAGPVVPVELAVVGKFAALAAGKATAALVLDTEAGPEPVGRETAELADTVLAAAVDIEPVALLDTVPAVVLTGTAAVAVGTDAAAGAGPRPTWATPSWEFAPGGHALSAGVDTAHVACGPSTAAATTDPWHARAATWLPGRSWPPRGAREN